jgi:hypothetical protein
MFENLKQSLSKKGETNNDLYKHIIKLEPGNTYIVRLIPNTENVEKSFYRHIQYGWISYNTGKYISALSPTTWGESDPIEQTRNKMLYRSNDEGEKIRAAEIKRSEKWLANAYVVDDPVNKANNGKVMILRFGKQLYKIIESALIGEESEDFGPRIFDLSKDGCNLKIKVEKQGDYPSYTSSRFTNPKEIEGLNEKNQEAIYKGVFDLEKVFPRKSHDELINLLQEHFFNTGGASSPVSENQDAAVNNPELVETKTEVKTKNVFAKKDDGDDMIKSLMDSLE